MPAYSQGPPYPRGLYSGDKGYSFGSLVSSAFTSSPVQRTANGQVTARIPLASATPVVGETVTIINSAPNAGTRFDGNYILLSVAVGASQLLTLLPIDDVLLHQPVDSSPPTAGTISYIGMDNVAATPPSQPGRAFGLVREASSDFTPAALYVDGIFNAAPGTFELDVEGAEVDQPTAYATLAGGVINAVNANNAFHVPINDQANFVRLTFKTLPGGGVFAGTIRA